MSRVILLSKDKDKRYCVEKNIEDKGTFIFDTDRELEVYDVLKKGDKFYSVGRKEKLSNVVGVDEIEFELNPETTIATDFTCPYCHHVDYDGWEKSEGETYCGSCGSTVNYNYKNENFVVEPVFPSSIIVIE
ncbi:hypothetical protein [Clostridium butyricum]|uniref:hypothetical protein n=1 Tax=Clostridium butyricum TaxID=1492 RepID=UPI0005C1D4D6|nr:hypothetical protein [Clostridium butyricum]KIU08837.1 hypothetical protein SC08_Contig83orf02871 [Clostridium butyricum]MBA8965167.1 hypothetical protein [Clostridium butyricum]MBA8970276.1 hypothetical protein [Clostridium butyricum]MBC2428851.1 hypothetical protein [Clostridium butyricum]NOW37855.1 hypothetical protein [Clostridium butyricum]